MNRKSEALLLMALLAVPGSATGQEAARSFAQLGERQTLRAGDTLWVAYTAGNGDPVRDVKVELVNVDPRHAMAGRRVRAAPLISRDKKGILVSLRW